MSCTHTIAWEADGASWRLAGNPERAWILEGPSGAVELSHEALAGLAEALAEALPRRKRGGAKAGTPWTEEEEDALRAAWAGEVPLAEMARLHERSPGSIEARLVKLGLIDTLSGGRKTRFAI